MAVSPEDPAASKEEDWHYSLHAVAFLDILGQREAFQGIRGVPHDPASETQLIEVLKRTVGFVPKFREGFQNIFETYAQRTGKELELPEEFREEFLRMRRSSIKLHGLSDAVVVWTSLMEEDQCGALNSIYGMLMASAGMSALALACKHAIRGGIELDGAIPLEPGSVEIYGPALAKAYELESRYAQHPRILIGEELMKYLRDMSVLEPRDRVAIHNKHMAEQCLGLIARDGDGRFIVDYLGPEVLRIAPEAFPEDEVLKPARQFVEDELQRFRLAGDQRLAARYERVLAYFDERLPGLRDDDPQVAATAAAPAPEAGHVVPYVVVPVDGAPPWKQVPADDSERQRMANRRALLQESARAAHAGPILEGPLSMTIRYTRNGGGAYSANIIGGVADALQGIVYANDKQLREVEYAEHPGDRERYEVAIAPAGLQVPIAFEPRGDFGLLKGNPAAIFPDDAASRWMLSLLAANQDIGLALKLIAPFLAVPRSSIEPHRQYRVSHMLYLFRLWIAHIHEGWVAFNQAVEHDIVRQVKASEKVEAVRRKTAELRGKRVGAISVGEIMEQCRHAAFHYTERVADKWPEQLGLIGRDFPLCITHGDYKDVDSRWLVADEYVLSRLNRLDFGNRELHAAMRDMAFEIIGLIRTTQLDYFRLRDPDWDKPSQPGGG